MLKDTKCKKAAIHIWVPENIKNFLCYLCMDFNATAMNRSSVKYLSSDAHFDRL